MDLNPPKIKNPLPPLPLIYVLSLCSLFRINPENMLATTTAAT